MNGPAIQGVTFDPRRLSQAPAAPATLSAGEVMVENGWTDEFCPVLFLSFTPIVCEMWCLPRNSRRRQTVSGPYARIRVSKQHCLSIRMWNCNAAITWRGEAVGKQLCIFGRVAIFVIVVDSACFSVRLCE